MFFSESLWSLRGGFLYTKRLCSIQGGNTVQALGLLSPRLALGDAYCPEPTAVWPTSGKEWVQLKQSKISLAMQYQQHCRHGTSTEV